ncbi:unnamed protein product [Danaus chrysippus]|uniref:(African queen) hypothetical protein n=1 Tax=Danaus chrysippus TaxID=151541 RepID=A0A8J2VVS6_9NEOP|nr:unnamed protein product [Danaus chrysippus]
MNVTNSNNNNANILLGHAPARCTHCTLHAAHCTLPHYDGTLRVNSRPIDSLHTLSIEVECVEELARRACLPEVAAALLLLFVDVVVGVGVGDVVVVVVEVVVVVVVGGETAERPPSSRDTHTSENVQIERDTVVLSLNVTYI